MRRIIKKQKQKPILMVEPPSDESGENDGNRIHQRRSIINELDLIKARVDQIIQDFEAESQGYAASLSVPLETLEDLFRQHESYGVLKAKELSAARVFFSKCTHLAKCLEETVMAIAEERANSKFTPRAEEFETALDNTATMLQQIKSLNAQMIKSLSDINESLRLKLQSEKAKSSEIKGLRIEEIINMYTNEAIKCNKMERTLTSTNEELDIVKSRNLHLMEQAEADKLKLQMTEGSRKELEEVNKKLRVEINFLKNQKRITQLQKNNSQSYKITSELNVSSDPVKSRFKPGRTIKSPSLLTETTSNNETSQQNNKNMLAKASLQSKKQAATKHTSRLLDHQLNYLEELMVRGEQTIVISEKQFSDLAHMTDDALKQKYQEEYTCLCDLVEMITLLLGSQGSEKLTAELESAAPEHLLAAQTDKPASIHEKISSMKTAVSRVMLEMKIFIKMKKKLTTPSKTDLKKVTEVQNWVEYELSEIDREITDILNLYELDKKEIEKSQVIYVDQLSKKLESNSLKLSKTLAKLQIPDQTKIKTILENISVNVAEIKNKPTAALAKSPDIATDNEDKNKPVNSIACNMPAIDEIRKNVASHLKAKHNVTISSKSWRTKAGNKAKLLPIIEKKIKTKRRAHMLPTLATCVEFVRDGTTTGIPLRAASKGSLPRPVVQRPKTAEANIHYKSHNQVSTQKIPTAVKTLKLTIAGRK